MHEPAAFLQALQEEGIDFFTGVPDSLLKDLLLTVEFSVPSSKHVVCANEGNAVALAAGYYLSTGKLPLVYLQNSGLGNAVNPLMSLTHAKVYGIPMLLLIGWRGQPGTPDEPQHQAMGEATLPLLNCLNVPSALLDPTPDTLKMQLSQLCAEARRMSAPVALICSKGSFSKSDMTPSTVAVRAELTREQAIASVIAALSGEEAVISTTGMASRELWELRQAKNQKHDGDLLNPGAMGHVSQIALGVALGCQSRRVVCLDGDGALVMHMGALVTIGKLKPSNFLHVILNNGVHDSVGGQPTGALDIEITTIAKACGYIGAIQVSSEEQVAGAVRSALELSGPCLVEVIVRSGGRSNLSRPDSRFQQHKAQFMQHLRQDRVQAT